MSNTRKLAICAVFGAIAAILMYLEFPVPLVPSFLKFDFSDLPAIITAFACGPVSGVMVCLIKNILHLFASTTSGVGEIANFIVGCAFVVPAGIIYKHHKSKKNAIIGAVVGTIVMAIISFPVNYFITYPFYYNFMPKEAVVAAYTAILPWADSIVKDLIVFNMPFTFVKGLMGTLICMLIYKPISPVLHGKR